MPVGAGFKSRVGGADDKPQPASGESFVRARTSFLLTLLVGMAGLTVAAPGPVAASGLPRFGAQRIAAAASMRATLSRHRHASVCARPSALHASCNAIVDLNVSGSISGNISANASPNGVPWGFGPADLQAAYQLPSASAAAAVRPSRSSTRMTCPPLRPTSPPIARSTVCRRAPAPVAAFAR